MIFEVSHKTTYHYTAPVAQANHLVHLSPRPHERQRVMHHSIEVSPAPATRNDFTDYFGNPASTVAIESSHSELRIHAKSVVEVNAPAAVDLAASTPWDKLADDLAPPKKIAELDAAQFLAPSWHTAITSELIAFAGPSFAPGRPVLECAHDLTHRIHTEFAYDGAATDIAITTDELLKIRRGVCQDFAHLLIASMRAFGLP
ncbi:MAG TPA: transglutaminase family protein, partial [Hyphomicrobiales bacterium]|nr:transglutaminase family protein [Hyphomicrobiales bacterium]